MIDDNLKVLLGIAAIGLGLLSYVPYIINIHKGITKPHAFSWFIWGFLTLIAFAAQVHDKGGAGAWVTFLSGVVSLYIAALAWKVRDINTITRSDWITFIVSLTAIPLWLITNNPLWSVILISAIDVVGYYPTFRKAFLLPHEEYIPSYNLGTAKHLTSIAALQNYSFVTVFYPAVLAFMNIAFVIWVLTRKRILAIKKPVAS